MRATRARSAPYSASRPAAWRERPSAVSSAGASFMAAIYSADERTSRGKYNRVRFEMSGPIPVAGAVRVGRLELGYSAAGIGPHVILLHSGGLSSRQWGRFAEELAGGYRVVSPDFLGYGRSSRWPQDEEFHFILDALAIEALLD